MSQDQKCVTCEQPLVFRWADLHGVGCCTTCGTPYTILHYQKNALGEEVRVEKPPEPHLNDEGLEIAKAYWTEYRDWVFPGYCDLGFVGDKTYSGVTREQQRKFYGWLKEREAK